MKIMHSVSTAIIQPRAQSSRNTCRPSRSSRSVPRSRSCRMGSRGMDTAASSALASTAPARSVSSTTGSGKAAYSAAPSAGPSRNDPEVIIWFQPPTRISSSAGTNWGIIACIAGC